MASAESVPISSRSGPSKKYLRSPRTPRLRGTEIGAQRLVERASAPHLSEFFGRGAGQISDAVKRFRLDGSARFISHRVQLPGLSSRSSHAYSDRRARHVVNRAHQ
jgi:hypothetical protein